MGDGFKGLLKVLLVVVSAGIGYAFAQLWDMMTPGGASTGELWGIGIVVFIASVIGLYYATRLGGDRG